MKKIIIFVLLYVLFSIKPIHSLIESEAFPELVYRSALKEGHLEKLEQMLESGHSSTQKDNDDMIPLAYAIKNNNKKMVNLLLKYGANINSEFLDKLNVLIYCVMLEKVELINFLVQKGVDINKQDRIGRTSLMIAVESCVFA